MIITLSALCNFLLLALIGWCVIVVKALEILVFLLPIAGIGLTVYLVAKELIKFNKKS